MKYVLLSILFLTLTAATAQDDNGKSVRFGIKAGINSSILSASINSESSARTGLHLGVYALIPKGKGFALRPELFYSAQGQKDSYDLNSGETTTKMNYLYGSFLLQFGNKFYGVAGPQVGFLLSAHEEGTLGGEKINNDLKEYMRSPDLSIVFGAGLNITDNLNLGVRANIGMTEIFEESSVSVRHRVLNFIIGYTF